MFSTNSVTGPTNLVRAVQALQYLLGVNPQAVLDTMIGRATGQPVVSLYRPALTSCSGFYCAVSNGIRFTFIGPTGGLGPAIALWSGYYAVGPWSAGNATNFVIENDANLCLTLMNQNHLSGAYEDVVLGYSLGGAVAVSLAAKLVNLYGGRPSVLTVGAPRVAGTVLCRQAAAGTIRRYMGPNDAVPMIPPPIGLWPQILTEFSAPNFFAAQQFIHPAGGLVLNTDGSTPLAMDLPPNADFTAVVAVPAWLVAQVTLPTTPHSLSVYATLAAAWQTADANPADVGPRPAPAEQPGQVGRAEVNRQIAANNQALFKQAEAQDALPTVMPPTLIFSALKLQGAWYVFLGQQIVFVGPSKKKALGIKNAGNDFLRRMGRMAVVDPTNLIAQMQAYITAAESGLDGISPPLATTYPRG